MAARNPRSHYSKCQNLPSALEKSPWLEQAEKTFEVAVSQSALFNQGQLDKPYLSYPCDIAYAL